MPGGDGTGPWGMGPMTGRAAGWCAGYTTPGFANPIPGRGYWGWGGGRGGWGRRNWYYETGLTGWQRSGFTNPASIGTVPYAPYPYGAPPTRENESEFLKGQAEYLEDALEGINRRLQELEAEKSKE